jgi:hypothetical protein
MSAADYIKVLENVFPHEVCDLLISEFNKNLDKVPPRKPGADMCPEPMAVFTQEILNIVDPILGIYLDSYLQDKIGENYEDYLLDSVSILKYENGDSYMLHPDNPFQITDKKAGTGRYFPLQMIVYLNEGYKGGEVEFPDYGIKHAPSKGDILIFPTGFAFPHKVYRVDSDRYILLCAVLKVGKDYIDEE